MMKADQLRELIIKPTLIDLVMFTEEAMELLVFTCAVESNGGTYIKQLKGPALGIYQMEPETYNDIWENYIKKKAMLLTNIIHNFEITRMPSEDRLIHDLRFATAMTRIHYARVPEALPPKTDILGMWNYYKNYYNTSEGAATQNQSVQKYLTFIRT